jgi:prevent-host-death family protein
MAWQVQQAKQHFSEVLRRASDEGGQVVTKHGREVAVVLDIDEYRDLKSRLPSFTDRLLAIPKLPDDMSEEIFGEIEAERKMDHGAPFRFPEEEPPQ